MDERFEAVISGVSARVPDCDNLSEFIDKLYGKVSMVGANELWRKGWETVPYYSGTVRNWDRYDNNAFFINRVQANVQIPLIPKLLEISYEAIIDAGINPKELNGTNTGIYMNAGSSDLDEGLMGTGKSRVMTGVTTSYASNRISYCLNTHGPSVSVCGLNGSVFYFLKKAIDDIRAGRIEACLVGTADFIQEATLGVDYVALDMLAEDGQCQPFDENAHGTVRSDGGVVFFLQEASKARRHRAVPLNFDYRFLANHSLDFVHHDSEQVIKMLHGFYAECNVDPHQISYVEAEGAGIKTLDELELKVLSKVFTENRAEDLLIGSVKSSVGRSESSACFMSLLKAVLSFSRGAIPPTLSYTTPNSQSPALTTGKIKVVTEETPLPGDLIAINTFSLNTAFGHGLVKRPPAKTKEEAKLTQHLMFLSSRTEEGLAKIMDMAVKMPLSTDFTHLVNGVFHRQVHGHYSRGVLVMQDQHDHKCLVRKTAHADSSKLRPLWFVFSGMGAQKVQMGKYLMRIPAFADVIDRCDAALAPHGIDIKYILTSDDETIFDDILNSFVGTTAVQLGLVEVLRGLGLVPDKYVGHSLGEQACAYTDGCLTLEETILCSWARGRASNEAELVPGMMAAVGQGYQDIKDKLPESIEVACHNSNGSCTLSGPPEDVKELVDKLKAEGVFAKEVNVSNIAYHSRYIKPAGELLLKYLKEIIPTKRERSDKWISTSVPKANWELETAKNCCAEYLTNNLLSPVLFEEAFVGVPADAVILEIAPQSLMLAILKRAFPPSVTSMALTSRTVEEDPAFTNILSNIGELYLLGYEPDPRALYPPFTYPVAPETPDLASFTTWEHSFKFEYDEYLHEPGAWKIMNGDFDTERDMTLVKLKEYQHLFESHTFQKRTTIPLSFYLNEVWKLLAPKGRFKKNFDEITAHFKEVYVESVVWMDQIPDESILFIQLCPGSGKFEVCLTYRKEPQEKFRGDVIVRGVVEMYENDFDKEKWAWDDSALGVPRRSLKTDDIRHSYQYKGYDLSSDCINVTQLDVHDTVSKGKLVWRRNWQGLIDGVIKAGMLTDVDDTIVCCPVAIQSLIIRPDEFKLMDYGTEVDFILDRHHNVLVAPEGIQMKGMIFNAPPTQKSDISRKLDCREFLPFFTSKFSQKEDFLSGALELLIDSCQRNKKGGYNINICECGSIPKDKNLLSAFKAAVQNHYPTNVNLSMNSADAMKRDFCGINLLVTSEASLKAGFLQQADDLTSTFILYHTDQMSNAATVVPRFSEPLQYADANEKIKYVLLKKKCQLSKNIYKVVESDWVSTLDNLQSSSKDGAITLIWDKRPDMNPHDIVEEMTASGNLSDTTRCVFILDQLAPTFSERNPFYAEQLQFGFAVNVLQNGVWGTLKKILPQQPNPENLPNIVYLSKFRREDIDIQFISLNTQKKRVKNYEHDVYVLEYSGITKDQKKVMGLAQYRPYDSNAEISIDSKLMWEIPAGVTMEDAATLPMYLSMANFAMSMCSTAFDLESVLVHNGSSFRGLTCIAVAYHAQLEIFTTVHGPEERKIVKQHFPQLEDKNIIDASIEQFKLRLMLLTGGRGADLVVSDVAERRIGDSWECVAQYGSLIDFNESNMASNCKLPMFHFLKCTTYHSCLKTGLLSMPNSRKEQLQGLVQSALQARAFVKLPRRVFNVHQVDAVARALNKEAGCQKILMSMNKAKGSGIKNHASDRSMHICNSNDAFFILSPSIGKSLSLVDWILVRGGRKIVMAVSNQVGNTTSLNSLISQYEADLLIYSTKKFTSGTETVNVIDQIKKLGPVSTLFNIYMDGRLASHIASLLPGSCQIVSVSRIRDSLSTSPTNPSAGVRGGGGNVKGNPRSISIVCDEGDTYLQLLDQALISNSDSKSTQLYSIRGLDDENKTQKQITRIREYLPSSFENLEAIGMSSNSLPKEDESCAAFTEICTSSLAHKYLREITPVFLISSSPMKKFEPLRRRLVYPLYYAKFSNEVPSTAEAAKSLYTSLSSIQPKGPCTIISESWNIPIATDLIKMLKENGRTAALTVLPITPKRLHFLLLDTEPLDDLILRNILRISKEEYESLYSNLDLETKLAEIIKHGQVTFDAELVGVGIAVLKKQIEFFQGFLLPKRSLDCPVLVAEMAVGYQEKKLEYSKISSGKVDVYRNGASYEELLADPQLVTLINERQLFSWSTEKAVIPV